MRLCSLVLFLKSPTISLPTSRPCRLRAPITAMADVFSPSANPTVVAKSTQSKMNGGDSCIDSDNIEKYGFQRSEMYQSPLAGTMGAYDRHIFLCYKNPDNWPTHVEGSESDRLPRLLAAAVKSRKNEIQRNTRLTICQGQDGTESSNGDVLIFPDMIRYRGLTHFDVENFVEDVLVNGKEWSSQNAEALTGSHVFVCAHGSRDRRCGVCGPALIKKFEEEIELQGLKGQVFVSPCSHIGGHKYAGNLIIFSSNVHGKVTGNWYGYVTPSDVPILLDQDIIKGKIVDRLWRGQMGFSEDEQKNEQRLHQNGEGTYLEGTDTKEMERRPEGGSDKGDRNVVTSCCQGVNGFSCCRDERVGGPEGVLGNSSKANNGSDATAAWTFTSWLKTWEQAETFAALAVIGAVASVAVAYSIYRSR